MSWLRQFLQNRYQRVSVEGHYSYLAPVLSGVPQGTVLAPLLFSCYINDLPSSTLSNMRLYADDALVYRSINSPEDSIILQQDLISLSNWSRKWLMPFNPSKCEYLNITNKVNPIRSQYYLDEIPIKETDHIKYVSWGLH